MEMKIKKKWLEKGKEANKGKKGEKKSLRDTKPVVVVVVVLGWGYGR